MKSVLISIQPKWCELIAKGQKTVEVRKTKPKLETPFKVYIYCTKDKKNTFFPPLTQKLLNEYPKDFVINRCGNGKVIGEFICNKVFDICIEVSKPDDLQGYPFPCTGLTDKEILQYLGNGKTGYRWSISDLVIYDKPKELGGFKSASTYGRKLRTEFFGKDPCCVNDYRLSRPPQSWCYIEEVSL